MTVKLLTEHRFKFLSLKGDCTGPSESTLVKYHIVGNHMLWLNYNIEIDLREKKWKFTPNLVEAALPLVLV